MHVQLTSEQEAQLAQIATRTGSDPQRLVEAAILGLLQGETTLSRPSTELPVLHLGAMTSLSRRDIYDDVR